MLFDGINKITNYKLRITEENYELQKRITNYKL